MTNLDSENTTAKPEIVLLLGAGAVMDVGLPNAIMLQGIVQEDISRNHPELSSVLRYITGAIQFGKACQPGGGKTQVNIEDLLFACYFLSTRETSYVYPFVSAWHEKIKEYAFLPSELGIEYPDCNDSFLFLYHYCKGQLFEWLNINEPHRLLYLRKFIDFINAGYKLRIFTLNYDECIEQALRASIGPINERWTTGFNDSGWAPELFDDPQFDIYYYKLHGSLDWVNDERLGICSVGWPVAKEAEEIPSPHSPLLIFGDYNKLQSVDPYLTLLYQFQRALDTTSIITISGYSFADKHINDMILQSLQRDLQKRCIVAQPFGDDTLQDLLPAAFNRFFNVEERFVQINDTTKNALEQDQILNAIRQLVADKLDELPDF